MFLPYEDGWCAESTLILGAPLLEIRYLWGKMYYLIVVAVVRSFMFYYDRKAFDGKLKFLVMIGSGDRHLSEMVGEVNLVIVRETFTASSIFKTINGGKSIFFTAYSPFS